MSDMKTVAALAKKQIEYEDRIERLEEELKEAKVLLRDVAERDLPEALEAAGLSEITLANGRKVVIEKGWVAGISKEHEAAAFAWLREHNHDGIIKRNVSIAFGRGEDNLADAVLAAIAKVVPEADLVDKAGVNYQTLKAFVKRQMEDGENIPADIFGIFEYKKAKIGLAKK